MYTYIYIYDISSLRVKYALGIWMAVAQDMV